MIHGDGPIPARLMVIGECPGPDEERTGQPFSGTGGQELNRMLHEAGIMRTDCFMTYAVRIRPPHGDMTEFIPAKKKDVTAAHIPFRGRSVLPVVVDHYEKLLAEIEMVQPNLIIALGNTPMWMLTGAQGILKWRGSMLTLASGGKLIPTFHPIAVSRQWELRALMVNDLRRAKKYMLNAAPFSPPAWNFLVRPGLNAVIEVTSMLLERADRELEVWIDFDLETRAGHIACAGLSWSRLDSICIPFMCIENKSGYWSVDEEAFIVFQLYKLLTHPHVKVRWQNGLYDAQYTYRHWHFVPNGRQDTMISQHAMFAALPKSLSFLASMYCDWYVYWKDEGKTWGADTGEEQLWAYNCQDCIYTREAGEIQLASVKAMGLESVHDFQQTLFYPVLAAMQRGVRVLKDKREELTFEVQEELSRREAFLTQLLGHTLNPASPLQMQKLFYEDLKQQPNYSKAKAGSPPHLTCDDEALQKIAQREPLLRPVINAISDIRTLGVFLSTFLLAPLDVDGRMRCGYNIGGNAAGKSAPYTFRLSSNKNAFGSGANLQNIPSEKSKSAGKAAKRSDTDFTLPNIRSMFGPDPGYTFFDMDLDRADLQVVVWESDDPMLKAALRMGADIHLLNVYAIDGQEPPPLEELVETHPKYPDHRGPRKHKREFAKVFCHATNYLGKAKTVAAHTGRGVHEIDRAQKQWFHSHPGILRWHERVIEQVRTHRFVENKFGFRWYIFDRIDEHLLPQAVAWIPQSTVAIVINKAWVNIHQNLKEVQVLLQVHDSLAGQFPTHRKDWCLERMKQEASIVIPYDEPLIIPVGIKTSAESWGACL